MRRDEMRQKTFLRRRLSNLAGACGFHLFQVYYSEKDLSQSIAEIDGPFGLQITSSLEQDIDNLIQLFDGEDAESLKMSDEAGSECVVARVGDEIAGFSWINRKYIYFSDMKICELPPQISYTYGSFVFPHFRGQNIFQCLTAHVYLMCKAEGFRYVCNVVDRENYASIAARSKFCVLLQPIHVLKLPVLGPLVVGRHFIMGNGAL